MLHSTLSAAMEARGRTSTCWRILSTMDPNVHHINSNTSTSSCPSSCISYVKYEISSNCTLDLKHAGAFLHL